MTRLFRPRLLTITAALLWLAGGLLAAAPLPSPGPGPALDPLVLPSPGTSPEPADGPAPASALQTSPEAGTAPVAAPAPGPDTPPPSAPGAQPVPVPSHPPTPTPGRANGKDKAGRKSSGAAAAKGAAAGPDRGMPIYTEADCIAIAIRQNPDVLAANKRIDASAATVTTAKGALYPALTATGYYQRLEQTIANGGAQTVSVNANGQTVVTASNFNRPSDYYADVRVTQNLYSGFGVRSRIAAAKLQTQAQRCDYQTQLDTTTLTVRAAFYQTLFAESNIGVRQQAVDLLGAQVKDQQDRLAAGSVGQLNVNRAQVQLANERPALLDAQAALDTAYATLAQALGVSYAGGSLRAPFRVRGTLDYRRVSMTLAECLQRALAVRPEVQSRLLAIDALRHQIVAEKAATRPQVTAFAAYDLYSEPDIRTVDPYYTGYTLGINVNWMLFDGFATRGRVRAVQAQVGEAEAALAATRKQVENDVYTAYTDLRTAESSLRPLSDNVRLAAESLDLTTRNFDAGIITTQLDVLQSRVDLTRSRSGELAGRLTYNNALARLERAMAMGRPGQGSITAEEKAEGRR